MIVPLSLARKAHTLSDILIQSATDKDFLGGEEIFSTKDYEQALLATGTITMVMNYYCRLRNDEALKTDSARTMSGIQKTSFGGDDFINQIKQRMENPGKKYQNPLNNPAFAVLDYSIDSSFEYLAEIYDRAQTEKEKELADMGNSYAGYLENGLASLVNRNAPKKKVEQYMAKAVPLIIDFAEEAKTLSMTAHQTGLVMRAKVDRLYSLSLGINETLLTTGNAPSTS